jgi:hypothetical protein
VRLAISANRSASQIRNVPSLEAVSTRRPSALKTAEFTAFLWPMSAPISRPLAASHIRAVPSPPALTTRRLSGLNAQ